jgi:hypothetical protein
MASTSVRPGQQAIYAHPALQSDLPDAGPDRGINVSKDLNGPVLPPSSNICRQVEALSTLAEWPAWKALGIQLASLLVAADSHATKADLTRFADRDWLEQVIEQIDLPIGDGTADGGLLAIGHALGKGIPASNLG